MVNRKACTITGAKATGTFILVEMLTSQEASGSQICIGNSKSDSFSPQGYVLDIGPAINKEQWGIAIGDRVLLQGTYTPVPVRNLSEREWGIVQPHDVKCVLSEADD